MVPDARGSGVPLGTVAVRGGVDGPSTGRDAPGVRRMVVDHRTLVRGRLPPPGDSWSVEVDEEVFVMLVPSCR
jgi:hypothetical protein